MIAYRSGTDVVILPETWNILPAGIHVGIGAQLFAEALVLINRLEAMNQRGTGTLA